MRDRRLAPLVALAGIACCAGTAIAAAALGGVALASLGHFGVVSAVSLVAVVLAAWVIDHRHHTADPEHDPILEEQS